MFESPRFGPTWLPGVLSVVALAVLASVQIQASQWQTAQALQRIRQQTRSEALATALQVERGVVEAQRGFEASLAGAEDLSSLEAALAQWLEAQPGLPIATIRLEPDRTRGPVLRGVVEPLRWEPTSRSFVADSGTESGTDSGPEAADPSGLVLLSEGEVGRRPLVTHPLFQNPATLRTAWQEGEGSSWWVNAVIDEAPWTAELTRSARTGDPGFKVTIRRSSGEAPSPDQAVVIALPVSAHLTVAKRPESALADGTASEELDGATRSSSASPLVVIASPASGTLLELAQAHTRASRWIGWVAWSVLVMAVVGLLLAKERSRRLALRQTAFIATVSHELRTPLAGVRAMGENLAAGMTTDPQRLKTYGDEIVAEVDRLRGTAEAALAVAGGDHHRPTDLRTDPVRETERVLGDLRLNLPVQLRGDPRHVRASSGDIRICLRNVLDNAVRHGGGPEGVEVVVDSEARPGHVRLSVLDRGQGVGAGRPSRLFKALTHGRKSMSGEMDGMGLGLALTRRLMTKLGGSLTLKVRKGGGTAAMLDFPTPEDTDERR